MKYRVFKKRVHQLVSEFAKRKIPRAFKDSRDRKAWVKEISDYHIRLWKRRRNDDC